jgi:hypothetical protein
MYTWDYASGERVAQTDHAVKHEWAWVSGPAQVIHALLVTIDSSVLPTFEYALC